MPPKKRAVEATTDSDGSVEANLSVKKSKSIKKVAVPVVPLDSSLPVNLLLEVPEGGFNKPREGEVRISAWNVCGIRASLKKGFNEYVLAEQADILILTETKVNEHYQNEMLAAMYPFQYWGSDPKKGNAGTAVLSKIEPISVVVGLPTLAPQADSAGRYIQLEFDNYYLLATYVPNAGAKLVSMERKQAWNIAFETHLHDLDAKKPVVWGGDINVVREEKDIRNWKTNFDKSPGCTQIEIDGYLAQVESTVEGRHKFIDAWRNRHPDVIGHYTYFSYMRQARSKGIGWRLDTFNVSERILAKVSSCEIRYTGYGGSDHVPVILDFRS